MAEVINLSGVSIGLANLPNQIHRKNVMEGFEFNLMVAGDSGLGKSTFINMLFKCPIYTSCEYNKFNFDSPMSQNFKTTSVVLTENGVKLKLRVIEFSGIAWESDDKERWKVVEDYINDQNNAYLKQELSSEAKSDFEDTRIHACFYFFPPFLHHLREKDLEFLKRLNGKVNIIPVISKADTLSRNEAISVKERIREELKANNIQIYSFDIFHKQESDELSQVPENSALKDVLPFLVVGSPNTYEVDGKMVLGRKYQWGIVNIENPDHSDYKLMGDMVIKTHMHNLIFYTNECFYEAFRRKSMLNLSGIDKNDIDASLVTPEKICVDIFATQQTIVPEELSPEQVEADKEKLMLYEKKLTLDYETKLCEARKELSDKISKNIKELEKKEEFVTFLSNKMKSIDSGSLNIMSSHSIKGSKKSDVGSEKKKKHDNNEEKKKKKK